jgi:phenylpropionate dioxygenase-like ring-hydroxylating dioxygenase large terminal subunit
MLRVAAANFRNKHARMSNENAPLFGDAAELWFPAEHARRLGSKPRQVWVAGEAIALFRDHQGRAHALLDRCPHRGVALSLGQVREDGCLECPFHGWRFAGDGACTKVPLNPEAKRERLGVQALPTIERGGMVWVFTGSEPSDEPRVPEWLERSDLRRRIQEVVFDCHWTRAMENMLDTPHLPWVHRRTIGRGMLPNEDATMRLHIDPREYGYHLTWEVSGQPQLPADQQPWLEWQRPCAMVLNLDSPLGEYRQHVFCVPGKPDQTRMLIVSSRKLVAALDIPAWFAMSWFEDRILSEDKAVVESSRPKQVPPAAEERSVATDEPTLVFRKWYGQHQRELERSRARHLAVMPRAATSPA